MTGPLRIGCPAGDSELIARIERTHTGPVLVCRSPNELRQVRDPGGPQVRDRMDEAHVSLTDERALRWADKGWAVHAWCPRCRDAYELPMEWLRSEMNRPGGWIVAPSTAH
jgi:hypothetical protein